MVIAVTDAVPDPALARTDADRRGFERALEYMDLKAGVPIEDVAINRVFIGSCTNSRMKIYGRRQRLWWGIMCIPR